MAIHEDGTMDVRIDGKLERRRYHVECGGTDLMGRGVLPMHEPETYDGEIVMRTIGDITPTIIKVREPEHEQEPDTFNPNWEQY